MSSIAKTKYFKYLDYGQMVLTIGNSALKLAGIDIPFLAPLISHSGLIIGGIKTMDAYEREDYMDMAFNGIRTAHTAKECYSYHNENRVTGFKRPRSESNEDKKNQEEPSQKIPRPNENGNGKIHHQEIQRTNENRNDKIYHQEVQITNGKNGFLDKCIDWWNNTEDNVRLEKKIENGLASIFIYTEQGDIRLDGNESEIKMRLEVLRKGLMKIIENNPEQKKQICQAINEVALEIAKNNNSFPYRIAYDIDSFVKKMNSIMQETSNSINIVNDITTKMKKILPLIHSTK